MVVIKDVGGFFPGDILIQSDEPKEMICGILLLEN